eukprot:299758-Pleurochrysis_carterae.AAC.2
MGMGMLHAPFLIAPFAPLGRVLQQPGLLCALKVEKGAVAAAASHSVPCMNLQPGAVQGRGSVSRGTQLWPSTNLCSMLSDTPLELRNARSSASLAGAVSTVSSASLGHPQKPLSARCSQWRKQARSHTTIGAMRTCTGNDLESKMNDMVSLPRSCSNLFK